MIWVMSYAASLLRIIASRLDGMETVQINNVAIQNDIHVYTTSDADPEMIGQQIQLHLGLYQSPGQSEQ